MRNFKESQNIIVNLLDCLPDNVDKQRLQIATLESYIECEESVIKDCFAKLEAIRGPMQVVPAAQREEYLTLQDTILCLQARVGGAVLALSEIKDRR